MSVETAEYIDELEPTWPLNTDAVSSGDDHIRMIKQVLQNSFPYVTGPVGVTDAVLTRGAVPVGAVTVFYMAAAPTGWARVTVGSSTGLRVVPTATPGGVSGGTDDPIVNALLPAHYHAVSLTSGNQNANHTHTVSGTSGNEASHYHGIFIAAEAGGEHTHYINFTSGSKSLVSNQGNIPTGGAGGNAALTNPTGHTHEIQGWSDSNGIHSHIISGNSGVGSAHAHAVSLTSGNQNADHAHAVSGNSATATVTEAGGSVGAWRPRYMDVILCERTS